MPASRIKRTWVAVLAGGVFLLLLMGFGVRSLSSTDEPVVPGRSEERLVIGFVGEVDSPSNQGVLRGVRTWLRLLDEGDRGIKYNADRLAAVDFQVRDVQPGKGATEAATRELIAGGATAIIGPSDQGQLSNIVEATKRSPVLVISPLPRGRSVRRTPNAFFLDRPDPAAFASVFDVLDKLRPQRPRRVALITDDGIARVEARRAEELAASRDYAVDVLDASRSFPAAAAVNAKRHAAVIVTAPLKKAVRWFERGRALSGAGVPWIIAARDLQPALDAAGETQVAFSVPWAPTNDQMGARDLQTIHSALFGDLPSVNAAAGESAALAIAEAVRRARSTDGGRLIRAMAELKVATPLGAIEFDANEAVSLPAQVVLISRGKMRSVWPYEAEPDLVFRSVPPARPTPQRPQRRGEALAPAPTPAPPSPEPST